MRNKLTFKNLRHKLGWLLCLLSFTTVSQTVFADDVYVQIKDNLSWGSYYVYLYDNSYWDDSNGSGASGIHWCDNSKPMTKFEGGGDIGNIYYKKITVDYGRTSTYISFTKDGQCGYANFYNTKAIYRGDFEHGNKLYIPNTTSSGSYNSTTYYSSNGSWNDPVYAIKHAWDGSNWSWKQLTKQSDGTYTVDATYGGGGCNYFNYGEYWIESPNLEGSPTSGDNCTFILDLSAGTITIKKACTAPTEPDVEAVASTVCSGTAPSFTTTTESTAKYQLFTSENVAASDEVTGDGSSKTITATSSITAATTYYVKATSTVSGCTSYTTNSDDVPISVDATSVAGTITGAGAICSGTGVSLGISGNTGTTYQWQSSTDNETFTDIQDAKGATYETGNLTAATYYKVKVKNGTCDYATSEAATVSIKGTPTVEDISGATSMYLGDTKTYSTSVTAATGTTISSKVWAMTPPTDVTALQGESLTESIDLIAIANTIGTGHEVKFTATDNCSSSVSKTKTVDVVAIPAPATCGISINRSTSRSGSGTSSDPYILFDGDTFTFTLDATHGVSDQFEGFGWNVNSSSSPTQFTNTGVSEWTSGQYSANDLTVGTAVAYTGYAWSYNTSTSYYSSTAKASDAIYVKHIQGPANLYLRGPIYGVDNDCCWPGTSSSNYHPFTKSGNTYTLTFNPYCAYCQWGSKEFIISTSQSDGGKIAIADFTSKTGCEQSTRDNTNLRSTLSYLKTDELTVTITWNGENDYSITMTKSSTAAPTDLYIEGPLVQWSWDCSSYTNSGVGYVHSDNTYSFTFNARNNNLEFRISNSSSEGGMIHLGTTGSSGQGWSFLNDTEGSFVASSSIVSADNTPITISLVYNTTTGLFDMTLASACNDPSSGFTEVSAVYNGNESPWKDTFADGHRSAVLSTTLTSLIYQWVLCDVDGNNEVTSPTVADNHVTLTNANTASCTATFDLPGTYYFKLKAGCSSASTSSKVLTVNVPYPSMGIQGLGINGSWNCCYAGGDGIMTRNGLTWTKTYNANASYPNGEFLVMQRYKRGNSVWHDPSCSSEIGAGWYGAYEVCEGGSNCGNTVNSATGDGTLNLTGLSINSDNYHNMYSTIGLSAGEEARVTVVMTGYNTYSVTLSKTCTTPTAANFTYNCTTSKTYNGSAQPMSVSWNGTEGGAITVYYKSGDGEYSTTEPVDAGTYSVAVSTAAGGGYCAVNQLVLCDGNYTIAKASRTITTGVSSEAACVGGTVDLSANTTAPTDGTITYTIESGSTGTGNISGSILECEGAGTIYVKASITEGTNYLSATSESSAGVTVRALPDPGTITADPVSPICPGTSTTLTLSGYSAYSTLQWYQDGSKIDDATSATYQTGNLTEETKFKVLVTLDGCFSNNNEVTIAVKSASLDIKASTSSVNPYTAVTLTAENNSSEATNANWTLTGTGSYFMNANNVPYTSNPTGVSSVILKPASSAASPVTTEVTASTTVDGCTVSDTYSVTPDTDVQNCQ